MSNYYCASRTNYFRVKDHVAFQSWAQHRGVQVISNSKDHPGHFALLPDPSDDGAFPDYDFDQDEEIDFMAELSGHLAEDSVAVILETGAEKLRYLVGYAVAVNAMGDRVEITLNNIYSLAARTFGGPQPTRAEY
ncbi:hypothetical protein OPIT5_06385 [Opitutaceae bacterium TAV5]|nr:hypothetical protein OPIT5_06385 [Opitutaceae bacterium TAV5]